MKMPALKREDGLTLPEIIVSAGIMTAVTASVILFFVNAVRLTEANRNMTTVTSHVNFILEDMRSQTFSGLNALCAGGQWTLDTNSDFATLNMTQLPNEVLNTTCSTATYGAGLVDVTINATWSDTASRARNMLFETLMGGL